MQCSHNTNRALTRGRDFTMSVRAFMNTYIQFLIFAARSCCFCLVRLKVLESKNFITWLWICCKHHTMTVLILKEDTISLSLNGRLTTCASLGLLVCVCKRERAHVKCSILLKDTVSPQYSCSLPAFP